VGRRSQSLADPTLRFYDSSNREFSVSHSEFALFAHAASPSRPRAMANISKS
jgi:hypothetical protein